MLGASLAAALLVGAAACTPGDDDDDNTGDEPAGNQLDDSTTTTTTPPDEPPGSQYKEVQPYIEALLDGYGAAMTTILKDPAIVEDPGNQTVGEFVALFEAGSDFVSDSLEGWRSYADHGVTMEPFSSKFPTMTLNVDGAVRSLSDDEMVFAYCTVQRYIYKENGKETERQEELLVPGTGHAIRVNGHWVLSELRSSPDLEGCFSGTEDIP